MKSFSVASLVSLFLCQFLVMGSGITKTYNSTVQSRAADTCGDPTVATTYYTAYSVSPAKSHGINTKASFAFDNTIGFEFEIESPLFRGWKSPGQINTVPLYAFGRIASQDFIYLTSTTGNPPPTPSGFNSAPAIIGYVYPTQICGSVPLYGAAFASPADHWYTTELIEHNEIISLGYTDIGIAAYVLSVDDCSCSS